MIRVYNIKEPGFYIDYENDILEIRSMEGILKASWVTIGTHYYSFDVICEEITEDNWKDVTLIRKLTPMEILLYV